MRASKLRRGLEAQCAKFHVPGCQSVKRLIFVGNCCQTNDAALAAVRGDMAALQVIIGRGIPQPDQGR